MRSQIQGARFVAGIVSTWQGARFVTSIGVCMLALPGLGPKMRTVSTGLFILCSRVGFSDSTRIIRFRSDRRGQLCTSKIHSLSKPFLLEGLSVVMGWVCWVSGKRRFHYVHKHRQKLALRGPGPKMRTSTWFQTQTFNALNLQTLPTCKPSNSQTFKV